MFQYTILDFFLFQVLFIASVVGILFVGGFFSFIWRLLITISGVLSPYLVGCGLLLIFASEMTTPTGIFLFVAGFICIIGFICVDEDDGLGGGTFITVINVIALFLVYDWYGLESVEFLIVTIGVFFTFVGEAIFSSVD